MMKPSFDDVVEFVKAGEVDPQMAEILGLDPDGQELLKQARFICKVLRDRYGASDDIGNVADADMAWRNLGDISALESASPEAEKPRSSAFDQSAPLRKPRRRRPPSIQRLLAGIDSERQDLGALSFAVGEERISASYQPSAIVAFYAKKFGGKSPELQLGLPGVQIQSMSINISLPESTSVGDPITLQLSRSLRQMPARYLDLVFMPDTGPFVRLQCDDQGSADLPAPIQSGILRIETDEPHFLRIKVEGS